MLRGRVPSTQSCVRALLLGGAGLVAMALGAGPALAQQAPATVPSNAETPAVPGPDGLRPEGLFVEADAVTESDDSRIITATGNVEARYEGRLLRADQIIYDTETGLVRASGNAQIINADGTVQYADTIELDDDLRAGVATNFAARGADNSRLAAAAAVRRSETINELTNAIFTPCDICDDEGNASEPTWSIQAARVVQNTEAQAVFYRDAVIRVAGIPVFYAPVFWHPDPTAERASGFLFPIFGSSEGRGVSYEQPYLWVISPSEDLVISPQLNQSVNPFLNLDWRRRFWSGTVDARLGYTYEREFGQIDLDPGPGINFSQERFGERTSRSYILAEGAFAINQDWRWGFSAERVSDKAIFDRYDIEDVYEDRGLFNTDYRRLISQVYAERQTDRSYFSVAMLSFQSLRLAGLDPAFPPSDARALLFERDGILPVVAPLVEFRWEPNRPVWGGRLRLRASAVALTRDRYVGDPVLAAPYLVASPAPDQPGVDTRRLSGSADWRRNYTTAGGLRISPFLNARADAYSIDELSPTAESETVARANVTLGVDLRYPLIRRFEGGSLVIEPMAQLALSPDADIDDRIPNEDSQFLELDETTLFDPEKFPGYDLYEGGVRLSLGVRTTWEWGATRNASLFLGRLFRAEDEDGYLRPVAGSVGQSFDPTGISETASDWVVTASFQPFARTRGWATARLDGDSFEVLQATAGVSASFRERDAIWVRYIIDQSDPGAVVPGTVGNNYESLEASGQFFLVGDWGVSFSGSRDLEQDLWRRSTVGLLYEDECLRFEVLYERNETLFGNTLGASDGISFRLTLATLGGSGYGSRNTR